MSVPAFALDPYLSRIEIARPPAADLRSLRDLHLAHRLAIPFENLDIQLGLPISLDIESVQQKLVWWLKWRNLWQFIRLFYYFSSTSFE